MVNVTREQALCIPFQLQFNEENIVKEKQKFEPPSDEFDVCYLDDPTIPVLVLKQRIYGNPFVFKEYMSTAEAPLEEQASGEDQKLETKVHVIRFINGVYDQDVANKEIYTK